MGIGDEGARTLNLRIANAALSQLSYVPKLIRYYKPCPADSQPQASRSAKSAPAGPGIDSAKLLDNLDQAALAGAFGGS